jgi:hypothetical protein
MAIIENMNPKKNPVTNILGGVFIIISAMIYAIKYIVPAFFVLKAEIPFEWYAALIPLGIGILLIFINDKYFDRIFNRAEKIVTKKTETPE